MKSHKKRKARKTKKPVAKYPGISPAWSQATWKWRARPKFDGRQEWGPLRDTQEQANDDYKAMKLPRGSLPKKILTLEAALEAVIRDPRDRACPRQRSNASTRPTRTT